MKYFALFLLLFSASAIWADCPAPPSCADRCEHRGERILRRCLHSDRDPEVCRRIVRVFLEECHERCRREACRRHCRVVFHRTFEECVDMGGDPADCRVEARRALRRCLDDCRD